MPTMSPTQKRIGSAILAVAVLFSGLNWIFEWRIFGRFNTLVLMLLIMITVVYVYIVPPRPEDLFEEDQDR